MADPRVTHRCFRYRAHSCKRSATPSWPGPAARTCWPLPLPETYRAAHVRRDEVDMFAGVDSADKDPRKSLHVAEVARPRAGPGRGLRRRHGVVDQLQHRLDVDLRAAAHVRVPRPPGPGERWGARHALPYHVVGSDASGVVLRVGSAGAQLGARRQGRRALQLRRRPGPLGPRRLDAGGQPAHLGLRDQLRRAGRPGGREGQPAHAQSHPPELGGGGHQRPVQLDRLPDARVAQRRRDEAGRPGPRLGRQRRPRAATPSSTS